MILRFLLVLSLIYGTWELTANQSLLLHNGISFIAGIIVATAVLALLTVFQIFIQYTLEEGPGAVPFSLKIDPIKFPQQLVVTVAVHILDLARSAKASESADIFVSSLVITKLLLLWNTQSDWSGVSIETNPIRLFFLLLFVVHLMATFVSISGITLRSVCGLMRSACSANNQCTTTLGFLHAQALHTATADGVEFWMRQLIAAWCSLVIVALINSEFLDLIFDDASSSLSIYKDILVNIVKNSLVLATVGIIGTAASLIVPLSDLIRDSRVHESTTWCTQRVPFFLLVSVIVYLFCACILVQTEDLLFYTFMFIVTQICCALEMRNPTEACMHVE